MNGVAHRRQAKLRYNIIYTNHRLEDKLELKLSMNLMNGVAHRLKAWFHQNFLQTIPIGLWTA
jgi:hypothetical protein